MWKSVSVWLPKILQNKIAELKDESNQLVFVNWPALDNMYFERAIDPNILHNTDEFNHFYFNWKYVVSEVNKTRIII